MLNSTAAPRAGLASLFAFLATIIFLITIPSGVIAAPFDTTTNATCYIENGAVHVRNIPDYITCVGRSDSPLHHVIPVGTNVDFGELAQAYEVTILFYNDQQCTDQDGFVVCQELAPTFCFITNNGTVFVENVYDDVQCITRVDDPLDYLLPNGTSTVSFADPAFSDQIMLSFYNDTACTQTIQVEPFIFCTPINGTSTASPTPSPFPNGCPLTVIETVVVPIVVTETIYVTATTAPTATATIPSTVTAIGGGGFIGTATTTTTTTATATATANATATPTPVCNLPVGPVCFVQNNKLYIRDLTESINCVNRSDDIHYAFPDDGAINFGVAPKTPNITITLFSDLGCSIVVGTLACQNLSSVCATPTPGFYTFTPTATPTATTTVTLTKTATPTPTTTALTRTTITPTPTGIETVIITTKTATVTPTPTPLSAVEADVLTMSV